MVIANPAQVERCITSDDENEVCNFTSARPQCLLLKTKRLRWFGHVCRMGQERLPKALLEWRPVNVMRRRGRCLTRCRDTVVRDARLRQIGNFYNGVILMQ